MSRQKPILKFFDYEHLPYHLKQVSKPIGDLARKMDAELPDCAEKSAGLRKLLEAKDCMVRAKIEERFGGEEPSVGSEETLAARVSKEDHPSYSAPQKTEHKLSYMVPRGTPRPG